MFQQYLHRFWVRLVEHIDAPLMLITWMLMIAGLLTVYSATYDSDERALSQMFNMLIGLAVMWGVAQIPPQKLMRFAVPLYVIGVVLLIMVFLFGIKVNGARRWLSLGFTRIQPSEILKIAMPLMLAWYFHKYEAALKALHFAVAFLLLLVPFGLIAKQPDLGTAILVGAAGFYVIFFAGLPWKIIIGMIIAGGSAAPFVWTMLHDYQRKRVLTFLDPESDPSGSGYHILQSKIALGSGGFFGKGYGLGSQSQLNFLPEKQTDFIFATLAEEFGFLGCFSLLVLYALVIFMALRTAALSHSHFGRLAAAGTTATFALYVLINGAMVMGLAPVVGVPMPMLSYGGTVMLTVMIGFGLVQGVRVHRYSEVTSGKGALM